MYERILNLSATLKRKSLFLLGPRQTGKSTFLKTQYPNAHVVNLLKVSDYRRYLNQPDSFSAEIAYAHRKLKKKIVVIDEIQKAPQLLDEIHNLIEEFKEIRFILTGSSARKLRREGVNLLGGRASIHNFHPIVSREYGIKKFVKSLQKNLTFGMLPSILNSKDPLADLNDYVGLYLKEEIQQEGLVRSLGGFSRFLDSVAQTNGQQVNFTELGNDAGVPPRIVREYYQVLVDTLVGYLLPAYEKTVSRKAMATAKFFFFDPGVTNILLKREQLAPKTTEFGNVFEQMIHSELRGYIDYRVPMAQLTYWRSLSQFEVDFIVETPNGKTIGIEVKSSDNPSAKSYRGLLALNEDIQLEKKIVVCLAPVPRLSKSGIEVLPLEIFLERLWDGDLF